MDIVIASNNQHKIREIREILKDKDYKIFSLKDKGINIEVDEDADTFLGNAYKKAKTICDLCGKITLADDSGLVVDSLNGEPGVLSARYAGEPCNDFNNNRKLLKALKGVKDRKARFVSAIVVCFPNGEYKSVECKVEGEILEDFNGEKGFGYDSLFYCYEIKKSFGEAEDYEKNQVSHRKKALAELIKIL